MNKEYITPDMHPIYFAMNKMVCQSPGSTDNAQSNEGEEKPKVGESKFGNLWIDDDEE